MDLTQFLQIGVVGVFLSIVMEFIKARFSPDSDMTRLMVVLLSVALGAGYWFLKDTSLWLPIVGILTTSTTVYSLFIRK